MLFADVKHGADYSTMFSKTGLNADVAGMKTAVRISLGIHYSNLVFGWCLRRGRLALMLSFLCCEPSNSELFVAAC